MRIDVIFDTICPWCYIGKRRLERALAQRPEISAEIRWRAFLLNPEMPASGVDRQTYLERKFGSAYRIQRILGAASLAAEAENIHFNFDLMERTPSSINSHRLIHLASLSGCQSEVVESVFDAYFVQGLDISDIDILCRLGADCGLDPLELRDYLLGAAGVAAIRTENAHIHRLGVSGIPCYFFNERYAVSGAQDVEILTRLLDIAREHEVETAAA
ncbi:MAG TPA: DsbA family oxidoreductase [Rhodospirillaceae bacterium]|nr:DsbA family oxidoreductase [Rhodospirillaceae bacterium]